MPGKIRFPERYFQVTDFSGLSAGKLSPSDIDGLFEYHDKAYIFYELKYDDAELPLGQRLVYERIATALSRAGKRTVVLVVEHHVADTHETVDVALCRVRQIYFGNECVWRAPNHPITAGEAKVAFLAYVDSKKPAA